MKITVVGCGRWGTLIAWYLHRLGHSVTLYGRESSAHMRELLATRSNGLVELPNEVRLSTDLSVTEDAEVIIVSVNSQGLRGFLQNELSGCHLENQIVVLCMKGLEIGSGKRLSQVATELLPDTCPVAVWLGPGHVQDFCHGIPNCMVIDSASEKVKKKLISEFSGELIRFYYGQDLVGNEIGAAAKNVIGIAAGILDGLGLSTLKGALMSRGTREISRLIEAMGGNPFSAYGLCHLGDYQATVFSEYSHNRQFGENFVKGLPYDALAEGYYTAKAICELADACKVDLPICKAVYHVLYQQADVKEEIKGLFGRSLKNEF